MSYTDFKEVTSNSSGSSTRYGGNDLKEIMQILNGKTVASRRPRIVNEWLWLDHFDLKPPISAPGNPTETNSSRVYADPSDFKIKIKKTDGTIRDIENTNIPDSALSQITNKAKLPSSIMYEDEDNNAGDHYLDFGDITTPANPSAGTIRLFNNTATGELSVRKSGGVTVSLEEVSAPGGTEGAPRLLHAIYVNSDGTADFTTLGAAVTELNNTASNIPVIIYLSAETYTISTRVEATRGNFAIIGAGSGRTVIRGTTSLPQTDGIFRVKPTNSNTGYNLLANANGGDISVTLSTADSANFSVGQYVLLKDLTDIDTEFPGRKKGELHVVTNVNTGTGVVTVDGTIYEAYTTAQTAKLAPLTNFYENITLQGMTFTSDRTTVTGMAEATTNFYFCRNVQMVDIEWRDVFRAGIELRQCWDTSFERCKIRNVLAPTDSPTIFYGIQIMGACVNTKVLGLESEYNRHGVTQGGGTGTNLEGRTRTLVVDGGTFRNTTESHLDVHQGASGVIFSNNTCISDDTNANAIQARSPALIMGNNIFGIKGRGVYLFGGANQSALVGNMITGCTIGIYVGIDDHRISIVGNTIQNCAGDAIFFEATSSTHSGDDTIVANNQLLNNGGDGIEINSAIGMMVTGNFIRNNAGVSIREVNTDGTLANIQIFANYIQDNGTNTPILIGTATRIRHNFGVITEASGTATITSASTNVTVTHGLAYTPSINDISVTPTNNPTNDPGYVYVSNVTSTNFRINVRTAPGVSTATFVWIITRTA